MKTDVIFYASTLLISSLTLTCVSIKTIMKIYKNSKSMFAITLVCFSLLDSISQIIYLICMAIDPTTAIPYIYVDKILTNFIPI